MDIAERCALPDPGRSANRAPAHRRYRVRLLAAAGAHPRRSPVAVPRDHTEHCRTGWIWSSASSRQKGFADYFLVVRDIVRHAPTHCGRGSVANSVVSYCLGITHVDPIRCGSDLRALSQPRAAGSAGHRPRFSLGRARQGAGLRLPRYPRLHSAMVANHNTFQSRGALREVAKVHGRPAGEIREVTRRIPFFYETGERLRRCWSPPTPISGDSSSPPTGRSSPGPRRRLVGVPRHLSVHPGGVVITPRPLTDYVPVESAAKTLASPMARSSSCAGHPVREGRHRGCRTGQDRSAGQPVARRDPGCHRRGSRPHHPPHRLHLVGSRRR